MELRLSNFVPATSYTLSILEKMGVLDRETANRIYSPRVYHLLGPFLCALHHSIGRKGPDNDIIDQRLARMLIKKGVQVPPGREGVFGENFSIIAEYNAALLAPVLTDEEGGSPQLREAIKNWDIYLHPFRRKPQEDAEMLFRRAMEENNILAYLDGISCYMRKSLITGIPPEEAVALISERLGKLFIFGKDRYLGRLNCGEFELETIQQNMDLVFELYRRVHYFRKNFRPQLVALVKLYSQPPCNKMTQAFVERLNDFLS